jgi:hypothetical protein
MKTPFLRTLAVATFVGLAGAAQAAVMTAAVDVAGNFIVIDSTGPQAPQSYDFNVNPSTHPNAVVFYDVNPSGGQSVTNIATLLADAYSVPASTLVSSSTCDAISGGCTGMTTTSTSFSLAGVSAFDYLALHIGGGELFFHWSQPITSMTLLALDGFPGGLSNYRAYLTTPVPGALVLFLSALGFIGARRKLAARGQSGAPALA